MIAPALVGQKNSLKQLAERVAIAAQNGQIPKYVAVEGPIGVGKTTLVKRLAELFGYPTMLEPVKENPFLDRFYADGASQALPTQLFFLLYRTRQLGDLPKDDLLEPCMVADFLLEKDELFAKLTLDAEELALYQQIQATLKLNPPKPDLVLYLQAPASVLRQRITGRGLSFEQDIDLDYLTELSNRYAEFFHYYEDSPLLIVNAADIDFANNDDHFAALVDRVINMDGTRQFFNPNPTLI